MGRPNAAALTLFYIAVVAAMGGAALLKGGFYIGKHEGDTLHLVELTLRMARGDWPHLDFMTPIGVLAVAPIAAFVQLGAGIGHAIFYAQIAVALVLMPAAVRAAQSRMSGAWAYAFLAMVAVLCTALVHGEAERSVSISMHYNRWAWAVSYIVIALALLAPLGRPRPWIDGALIGAGLGLLALTKMTYFAAFFPPVLIVLLARRQGGTILAAALAGLAVAAAMTAAAGIGFWEAYLGDLMMVTGSKVRPQPGAPIEAVIGAPAYLGATMILLATVVALRQAGRSVEGMALLFVMPGFFFVTYQNFGNDPQWLYLVALLAVVLRPDHEVRNGFGWEMRGALTFIAVAGFAHGAPSALNLVYSPFRHLGSNVKESAPLLPTQARHQDIAGHEGRLYRVRGVGQIDGPGSGFVARPPVAEDDDDDFGKPAILKGEELADCELQSGFVNWFASAGRDLEEAGYGGARIVAADLFSSFWMFGDLTPVPGAAAWYYGGLVGFENADYVIVPLCPTHAATRRQILEEIDEAGMALTEVRRTPIYILLAKSAE